MVAMKKVSVTLDENVLEGVRRLVGARGLSAYVNEALKSRVQQDGIARMLDRLDAEYGPVPADVQTRVDSFFDNL